MAIDFSAVLRRDCAAANTDGWGCYKLPVPAVVGIAVGSVIVVFTLSVILFFWCRIRRRRKERKNGVQKGYFFYRGAVQPDPIPFNPDAY